MSTAASTSSAVATSSSSATEPGDGGAGTDFDAFMASLSEPGPVPSSSASASDDPFGFLPSPGAEFSFDPFISSTTSFSTTPVASSQQPPINGFTAAPHPARRGTLTNGTGRVKAPSVFITSPTQRAQMQRREIQGMGLEKAKEVLRGCESLLSQPSRLASLADGGASIRTRHALLLSRIRLLESSLSSASTADPTASSSSSSASSSSRASNVHAMDIEGAGQGSEPREGEGQGYGTAETTPVSVSPRSWTGGVVGLKKMLMDDRINSEHGMTMRESLELQSRVVQSRREAQALQALEQMLIEDADEAPRFDRDSDGDEVVLDFDELSYSDDEGDETAQHHPASTAAAPGTGRSRFGEPPDEEALWAMAEAAGFPRR